MTKRHLPSDLLAELRQRFAKFETTGVVMKAPAVQTICKTMLTIQEIARDLEEDYRMAEMLLTDKFERLAREADTDLQSANSACNVINFKPKRRTIPINNGGGDAA